MLYINSESPEETTARLLRVLATATITWLPTAYKFEEIPAGSRPAEFGGDEALAWVRNQDVWCRLLPTNPEQTSDAFGLLQIQFPEGTDNSGFVGWLAGHLKQALGTGVFVICGYDSRNGGIYDYTGFPWELTELVRAEIEGLREIGVNSLDVERPNP